MAYLNYNRKLKMGLVGGGPGAFIGDVHRKAAILDGGVNLVSGTFSRHIENSKEAGQTYNINPERVFDHHKIMIQNDTDWYDYFINNIKKDDLADTYLMNCYYISRYYKLL